MDKLKMLVTGCCGFIPSHLVDTLLAKGYEVVGVDNFLRGTKNNLKNAIKNPNFKFYEVDCSRMDLNSHCAMNILFDEEKNIHTVFHLAANSDISSSLKNPDTDFDNTFVTTYNILKQMWFHNIKNIVFSSTSAVYGDTGAMRVDEKYGPLMPMSHYGAAKLASEAFISSFCNCYDIKSWIIRFPNVVGSRATHGAIYDFVNKLNTNPNELEVLGDGNQEKPYIHVSELIDAIMTIWMTSACKVNVYNVAPEDSTTVKHIAEWVVQKMNSAATIKYTGGQIGWVGDVPKFAYNSRKLREKLNFELKLTSDEAVKKAIGEIINERQDKSVSKKRTRHNSEN